MSEIDVTDLMNNEVEESSEEEMQPEQEDMQPEDPELGEIRAKKILKLQFYLQEFPDKLSGYTGIPLHELNIAQLDGLQKEFTTVVSCQSNVNFALQTFSQTVVFSEILLCNYTPIKAKGLSNILKDKALIDDVKAWTLENIDIVETKPEYRIACKILSSIMVLHQANTQLEEKEKEAAFKAQEPERNEKLKQVNEDPKYAQL